MWLRSQETNETAKGSWAGARTGFHLSEPCNLSLQSFGVKKKAAGFSGGLSLVFLLYLSDSVTVRFRERQIVRPKCCQGDNERINYA